MTFDEDGMRELLARSTVIGTQVSETEGDEVLVWRSDNGEKFQTTYEIAARYKKVTLWG